MEKLVDLCNKNNKIIVAGLGLEGMVVVVTDDAVLVCPKNRVQEVKKCVEYCKNALADLPVREKRIAAR